MRQVREELQNVSIVIAAVDRWGVAATLKVAQCDEKLACYKVTEEKEEEEEEEAEEITFKGVGLCAPCQGHAR